MISARDVALSRALATLKLTHALTRELQSEPALLKELRRVIAENRRARRPTVPLGRRGPKGSASSHRSLQQRAGRRGAAGLADSGGSSEPAAKGRAPDVGYTQPPASTSRATGEEATLGGRYLVPRGRGDIRGRSSRGCSGRNCRPATVKWAAQAHSQGI